MVAALFHSAAQWGAGFPKDLATVFGVRSGGAGVSETDQRYRNKTWLARKLSALRKLPIVTESLQPACISLTQTVTRKTGRRSRRFHGNANKDLE
jgi:hypothetical protein